MKKPENVDAYIANAPNQVKTTLKLLRATIKKAAPQAQEKISYGMPYYSLNGRLAYFAAHKNHIGFYPLTSAISKFRKYIKPYKFSKGSIQFPLEKPVPIGLVKKIIKFRIKENLKNN